MGCYNSIVINSDADKVWSVIIKIHDLSWSKNVITKVEVVGDISSNEIGSKRILNEAFYETLQTVDNVGRKFSYSIDDGSAVVSKENVVGYIGEVTVFPVTENNTSFVLWTSKWESAKEGGVADFCNPIYHALLQDLKNHFS